MVDPDKDLTEILKKIEKLEKRVAYLEKMLSVKIKTDVSGAQQEADSSIQISASPQSENMFPLFGVYIFFFALILSVIQKWDSSLDPMLSVVSLIVGAGLLLFQNKILTSISGSWIHLRIIAYFSIYFGILKLNYFSTSPVITNHWLWFGLLIVTVAFFLYYEQKSGTEISKIAILVLYSASGLTSGYVEVALIIGLSALLLSYFWEKNENVKYLLPATFIAAILIHYTMLDLPDQRVMQFTSAYFLRIFIPILTYFSAIGFLSVNYKQKESTSTIVTSLINLLFTFPVILFLSIRLLHPDLYKIHFIYFILAIALASWHWIRYHSKYSTFLYAGTAYTAMTISILTFFTFPDSLLWLCLQSLFVIITAVWFRSRLLVLANFFIFILLFILSVVSGGENGFIYGTFGLTALLSARILNWQKQRLTLQTEQMRNAYLISAFIILPVAFYYLFPIPFFALSLNGLAIGYFILRIILNIKKYFYMSLGTLLLGVGFLLFFGFRQLEPVYLIVSFFTLGITIIIVSLYKPRSEKENIG